MKKNQIQNWQAHTYLTFFLLFKGVFALHLLYTWLVSSLGRHLRLKKKQIASTNTTVHVITYSYDEITQIQDVQEVISLKLTLLQYLVMLTVPITVRTPHAIDKLVLPGQQP